MSTQGKAIKLSGPLWTAEGQIMAVDQVGGLALRTFFVAQHAYQQNDGKWFFQPGTVLALCTIQTVRIQAGNRTFDWQLNQSAQAVAPPTIAALQDDLAAEKMVLLLLAANPASVDSRKYLCLGGAIPLPHTPAAGQLYEALSIAAPPSPNTLPLSRRLAVHSSGVSAPGSISLPWQTDTLKGVFRLEPGLRLTLDRELLSAEESTALRSAWRGLGAQLNPRNPVYGLRNPQAPTWVTLDLADPAALPQLEWVTDADPLRRGDLKLRPAELTLLLSDRHPDDAQQPPTSLAQVTLGEILVTHTGGGAAWRIEVQAGTPPMNAPPTFHYSASFASDVATYRERFELSTDATLDFAFDPVQTPQRLRQLWGLPLPVSALAAGAATANLVDFRQMPFIWGAMPLARGWAQIPIPNLTDQILHEATPSAEEVTPLIQSSSEEATRSRPLFSGAVSYGNRRDQFMGPAPAHDAKPDEQQWSVVLTDAAQVRGTWHFDHSGGPTLVTLALAEPELILAGFFWLATGKPSKADALPNLSDWVTGLQSFPLQRMVGNRLADRALARFCLHGGLTFQHSTATADAGSGVAALQPYSFSYHLTRSLYHKLLADFTMDAGLVSELQGAAQPSATLRNELATKGQVQIGAGAQVTVEEEGQRWLINDGSVSYAIVHLADRLFVYAGASPARPPAAIIWQRHATLPMIQALPLTQRQWPPNHPSASRQLAPFAVVAPPTVDGPSWPLLAFAGDVTDWPGVSDPLQPLPAWANQDGLFMTALSLPGLLLDPHKRTAGINGGTVEQLRVAYRYDLPYTDELNALAQVPTSATSPAPDADTALPALAPESYAHHWDELARRAILAALDGVDGFDETQPGVHHLIEPYVWPVQLAVDQASYPGAITMADTTGVDLLLRGDNALRGIEGRFRVADGQLVRVASNDTSSSEENLLPVISGSMAAALATEASITGLRDQAGLLRGHSTMAHEGHLLLTTPVVFLPGVNAAYDLVSTQAAVSLKAGTDQWQVWLRDVPLARSNRTFLRQAGVSTYSKEQDHDINDAAAQSPAHNFLQGYEWRLFADDGGKSATEVRALPICGLAFFPLTLEKVTCNEHSITSLTLIGRLQLPVQGNLEQVTLSNAVQLTFQTDAGQLELTEVTNHDFAPLQWPLAPPGVAVTSEYAEAGAPPWLEVGTVRYDKDTATISAIAVRLHFVTLGQRWQLPLPDALHFRHAPDLSFAIDLDAPASDGLALTGVTGALALAGDHQHSLTTTFRVLLAAHESRPILEATLHKPVLAPAAQSTAPVVAELKLLQKEVTLTTTRTPLTWTPDSIAFAWQGFVEELELLPGMPLPPATGSASGEDTGYGVLIFDLRAAATTSSTILWQGKLKSAFVEALLHAQWGAFLQDGATGDAVFAPSAGNLTAGYTARWQSANVADQGLWEETLLLNGMLEVRNLISWPTLVAQADDHLTLPATTDVADLRHVRHSMRILLNQHTLPANRWSAGTGSLLFDIPSDGSWEFLAVVEHQLRWVDGDGVRVGEDRRWSTVQEVRLTPPAHFQAFLTALDHFRTPDPTVQVGYFAKPVREQLKHALEPLRQAPVLFVEASAHHWVARQALPATVAPTTQLQFLPGGSQRAGLTTLEDYQAPLQTDPLQRAWSLLSLPFLGRLVALPSGQDQDREEHPLLDDPVWRIRTGATPAIQRDLVFAFANRGDTQPLTIQSPTLDTQARGFWPRLDPISVERSWRRLLAPPSPERPALLGSILAALPDSPARLSRVETLAHLFELGQRVTPSAPVANDAVVQQAAGPTTVAVPLQNESFQEQNPSRHPFWRADWTENHPVDRDRVPNGWQLFELGFRDRHLTPAGWAEQFQSREKYMAFRVKTGKWGLPRFRFPLETDLEEARAYRQLYGLPSGVNFLLIYCDQEAFSVRQPGIHVVFGQEVTLDQGDYTLSAWIVPIQNHKFPDKLRDPITDQSRLLELRNEFFAGLQLPPEHSRIALFRNGVAEQWRDGSQTRFHVWQQSAWRFRVNQPGRVALGLVLQGAGSYQRNGWIITNLRLVRHDSPPLPPPPEPQPDPITHLTWRPDSLLTLAAGGVVAPTAMGWHLLAPHLTASPLWPQAGDEQARQEPQRHVAAMVLPAQPAGADHLLSLAASPYCGLAFVSSPQLLPELQVVVAELLCPDPSTSQLAPLATHVWDWSQSEQQDPVATVTSWAQELHRRLAPAAPVAVLRLRKIHGARTVTVTGAGATSSLDTNADRDPVVVVYSFMLLGDLDQQPRLIRQVNPLRAPVAQLRYREGQFGGQQAPQGLLPFELAPPQVTGLQPIYVDDPVRLDAPWGVSAIRAAVRYAVRQEKPHQAVGTVGAQNGAQTIWWQAPQHQVQFRTAGESPAAGLPPHFRAPAIKSLLPVIPNPALPAHPNPAPSESDRLWQPILPGELRFLILGTRAGAMLALRQQLLRQTVGNEPGYSVSGSIPVQHRAPRPVSLPPNRREDRSHALQTWSSYFSETENALVTAAPADEAFFAPAGFSYTVTEQTEQDLVTLLDPVDAAIITFINGLKKGEPFYGPRAFKSMFQEQLPAGKEVLLTRLLFRFAERQMSLFGARRLRLVLLNPPHGEIGRSWTGELQFGQADNSEGVGLATETEWQFDLLAQGDSAAIKWVADDQRPGLFRLRDGDSQNALATWLTTHTTGDTLVLHASVRAVDAPDGLVQRLRFPLRLVEDEVLALPLTPVYIHFEDPEYNRLLATPVARATAFVPQLLNTPAAGSEPVTMAVTLATDRKRYNPDSVLYLRYDWDDERAEGDATLTLQRVVDGVAAPIRLPQPRPDQDGNANSLSVERLTLGPAVLLQLALADLRQRSADEDRPVAWSAGDGLELTLRGPDWLLILRVDIVQEAVDPAPQAGYALLRRRAAHGGDDGDDAGANAAVECVRFAWGPQPARIDLVGADDLRLELVRRRAVFQWLDAARPGAAVTYVVQKLAMNGATHIPTPTEFLAPAP